jgi:ornithine cyclodeaminase/alanine dehydrogenase-like protein (mu-crystallin family)
MSQGTLLLSRSDVAATLGVDECLAAVEQAFRLHAECKSLPPGVLGVHAGEGGFHVKTAGLRLGRPYFAAKTNANFPGNPARFGLPTIQGVVLLFDAERGTPLAALDSMELTALRTAAATAVAAKYLAREDARILTLCGCGTQGRAHLRALLRARPVERVLAFDADRARAAQFCAEMHAELKVAFRVAEDLGAAIRQSDLCVTCTTASRFLVHHEDVPPGMFLAGVGADNPHKQELDPQLFSGSKVVVDSLEQCASIGDLHHAIAAGCTTRGAVYGELGEIVAGHKPGRTARDEITLFDSTGTALQDVAAAAAAYERALASGRGLRFDFSR